MASWESGSRGCPRCTHGHSPTVCPAARARTLEAGKVPGPCRGGANAGGVGRGSPFPGAPRKLYWTDGDNISMANMDGIREPLLEPGVGTGLTQSHW